MRPVVFAVVISAGACVGEPAPSPDDVDLNDDDDDDEDTEEDQGPCPALGAGLSAEETGAFVSGDDPDGVVVLMGGAAEVDRAAARFVDGAGGGDVLVLRASGSTSSYTSYFSNELSSLITTPASAVATVRVDEASAGADAGLLCRVRRADAIWLAGGDQSDYLLAWPTALHEALAAAVARGAAVGGTSAGAMSWSATTFDARDGGVTSSEALGDPDSALISTSPSPFGAVPGVLVDTHFQARDREGRLLVFLARQAQPTTGLGIDENTALVIDDDVASVLSDDGGAVWAYAIEGEDVVAGAPLSLSRGLRRRLSEGQAFTWPVDLDIDAGRADDVAFAVVDGVIVEE